MQGRGSECPGPSQGRVDLADGGTPQIEGDTVRLCCREHFIIMLTFADKKPVKFTLYHTVVVLL